jgi:hypothetical protein
MQTQPLRTVRPDAKGRITLGKFAEGVSGFNVSLDRDNRIILEPLVEIPAHEAWLFKNKTALKQLTQGIKQAKENNLHDLGSFSKHLNDED